MFMWHWGRYTVRPFPRRRQAAQDLLALIQRKHLIHGLAEVDVTYPRALLADFHARTGEEISFTAWVVTCVARAVKEQPTMQAYRQFGGLLLIFRDVDVTVLLERRGHSGQSEVVFHVVRAADTKSVRAIHAELRAAQHTLHGMSSWRNVELALVRLYDAQPRFARRLLLRLASNFPALWTPFGGTVGVTAVGMFAKGRGSWGIPMTCFTLDVTVGGIAKRQEIIDGQSVVREYLSITVSVDHDIVDGAPAARFGDRLAELLESGYGLDSLNTSDQCEPSHSPAE